MITPPRAAWIAASAAAVFLLAPPELRAAQEADAPEKKKTQDLAVRATEFIYVEGTLPFVPTANTIVSKLPLALQLTPSNVGIVTRALFTEQYGQTLSDALVNVSNINVQPGFGVHDFFVVRGFDSLSSTLILTDGAPEPEATFYQLYNVDLVEVLKGPGGFLYGSNPLAGAVNLVRKQPFGNQALSVGAAFGSFATGEGTVDYNYGRPDGKVAFRLNALVRDSESHRENKDSTTVAINPALSWQIADRHSLHANFEYARSDFSPEAGIPLLLGDVPQIERDTDFNSPLDRSEQDINRFQIDYQGQLSDTLTVRNKFYYRGLDWVSDGTLLNGAFPEFEWVAVAPGVFAPRPTGVVSVFRTQILLDDEQTLVGNQLEAVWTFDTGGVSHSLLTGFEASHFGDEFTLDIGLLPKLDLFSPVDPGDPVFVIPGFGQAGDSRSNVVAPYVIDQISLSQRFQVLAGARLDVIDFEDDLTGRARNDEKWSPMLGAVFLPTPDVALYANYSRSFAPPSPRAFGDLAPEESEQVELGVKVEALDGRARLTAAVYHVERQNIAIPDDNGFTQQIGDQRSRGFEIELVAEPGSGLRGTVSYAYNDAELTEFAEQISVPTATGLVPVTFDRSGNRPAFAPEHLLNFWGSKTFTNGLAIGVGGRYIGEQFIAEDNSFTAPDSFVLSASAAYAWDRYRLSVNVENATDTRYLWRGFGSQSVTPAAPVAAFLRLGYAF